MTAMGRLTHQKGFDLLLQAFSRIAERHPDWQLLILGEGDLRNDLERQRAELGLTDRVQLPGVVIDPYPVLRSSDMFVMASRFEGFPYALLEAMACGLPVIYADCPSGPGEIINNGSDGILTPTGDVEALAIAMDRLMNDEGERQRLAGRAPEAMQRFSLSKTVDAWEELFAQVTNSGEQV
jgi:glycosyltransferase involved in cell wall biosynthesis